MKPVTIILFFIFIIVPLVEIYVLIEVGEVIGAAWTVVAVVTTAILGAWLVKLQGILTFQRAINSMRSGEAPATELAEGLFLLLAGAFLITPGFVTDTIGFLCLTPPLRRSAASFLISRIFVKRRGTGSQKQHSSNSDTFEKDFRELKD